MGLETINYKHIEMTEVDSAGNLTVLYPANKSTDVKVVNENSALGGATTVDEVLGKLKPMAFADTIQDATTSKSGLMSAADKTKLDKVNTDKLAHLNDVTSPIQGQLNNKAASNHVHGNITNDGKIGAEANKVITTGVGGTLQASNQNSAFNKAFCDSSETIAAAGVANAGSSSEVARADHVHPAQTTISGNAGSATKLATGRLINGTSFDGTGDITTSKWGTARNVSITGAVTAGPVSVDGSAAVTINATSLDGSKITGMIPLESIPHAAVERCIVVENDEARLKLTKEQAQIGDTVKVKDTGKMYFIVNDDKLNLEEGYEIYTAGAASSVPWSGITGKPETFTPSAHNHGALTNDGKIGAEAGKVVTTGAGGAIQATNAGTAFNKNFSTVAPMAAGVAAAGSSNDVAHADHVHPAQTTISGNAGSATKLATGRLINGTSFDGTGDITTSKWGAARKITLTGGVTGVVSGVDGAADITIDTTVDHTKLFVVAEEKPSNACMWYHVTSTEGAIG